MVTDSHDNLLVLILAAGEGTRMCSGLPKVLHLLCEKPLLWRVIQTVNQLTPLSVAVVVGHGASAVEEALAPLDMVQYIVQPARLGSGEAVRCASKWMEKWIESLSAQAPQVLVLCGDTPFISAATLRQLVACHRREKNAVTVLSELVEKPFGYGRIVRNRSGQVQGIVEEKDADSNQKKICEINSGVYCFEVSHLLAALPQLKNDNAKGEFYLTDTLQLLRENQQNVQAFVLDRALKGETMGINTRTDLAQAETLLQQKIQERWTSAGVTILQPSSTYIAEGVVIGKDTVLLPGTMLMGKTSIGSECRIGPNSFVENSTIGSGVSLRASFVLDSVVEDHAKIGPFSHIRGHAEIGANVKVGNFTEVKKSKLGRGSKVSHLSYIGDTAMGESVNVGAGTITCNYDGKNKFQTEIGAEVFIGSNTNLVAPVKIGRGAVIGAGSTITKDVPEQALAVERSKQIIKPGWSKKKK